MKVIQVQAGGPEGLIGQEVRWCTFYREQGISRLEPGVLIGAFERTKEWSGIIRAVYVTDFGTEEGYRGIRLIVQFGLEFVPCIGLHMIEGIEVGYEDTEEHGAG